MFENAVWMPIYIYFKRRYLNSMRVALETSLTHFVKGGSAVYSANLAKTLEQRSIELGSGLEIVRCDIPEFMNAPSQIILRKAFAAYWQIMHAKLILPFIIHQKMCDLVHYTFFIPISSKIKCPVITSVMDIIPFIHPEWWPLTGGSNQRFKDNLYAAIQRSDHIIAISESTRRDILEYFRLPESKVSTILLGPGLELPKLNDDYSQQIVRGAYEIEPGYILCVGSQAPNKNLKSVVEAYGILNQQGIDLPQLVITGPSIGSQKEFLAAIDRYQLESKIIFTGYVPIVNLAALYRSAGVFVYPSLYEGFGLVVLEAMSCQCPVITSNTSSLPEVVGESAITIDPQNPYELADAIRRVLLESGVAEYLRKKGEIQVKKFSWENCASETYRVYQKVLEC